MKLYNVPNNTKINVLENILIPPGAIYIKRNEELMFYHIDGMYSYCKNKNGNVVHLVAWADVKIIN